MAWSEWQSPWVYQGTSDRRAVQRSVPANTVYIYNGSTSGDAICSEQTTVSSRTRLGWMLRSNPNFNGVFPGLPSALTAMLRGVDYAVRPDRQPTDEDAYIEYEAGAQSMTWKPLRLSLTGVAPAPFRVRLATNISTPLDPSPNPGALTLWPSDPGQIVFSGDATTPVGSLGTITVPANTTSWLIYVESDAPDGTSTMLTVGFGDAYPRPDITTTRWRYWIPDEITHPVVQPSKFIRSIVVDCSGDAPAVLAHNRVASDADLDPDHSPPSLFLPDLGINVLASQTYYTPPSARSIISVWNLDGTLRSQITVSENGGGNVVGLYANPDDHTECAVVTEMPMIFVVNDLDTTPRVTRVIRNLPDFYDNDEYSWPYSAADPYRKGPDLLGGPSWDTKANTPASLPLKALPLHDLGPTVEVGRSRIDPWYPIGRATQTPDSTQRHVWGAQGELVDGSDPESEVHNEVYVTDYRDDTGEAKTSAVVYRVNDLLPGYQYGTTYIDSLAWGSHHLSASHKHGFIVSGFTALSDYVFVKPDGGTMWCDQFSATLTKIVMPPNQVGDPIASVVGLPQQPVTEGVTLTHDWEGFYAVASGKPTGAPTTPAGTSVVGEAPVLSSADQGASYLEYDHTDLLANGAKAFFGVRLAPYTPPEGARITDLTVEIEFDLGTASSAYYHSVWLCPVSADGTIDQTVMGFDNFTTGFTARQAGWRSATGKATTQNALSAAAVEALSEGRLALVIDPSGGNWNNPVVAWNVKVSSVKVDAVLFKRPS